MAELKINLELDLDEIKNLWYLIQNTKALIKAADERGEYNIYPNWTGSQKLNLSRLEKLNEVIEPLAER